MISEKQQTEIIFLSKKQLDCFTLRPWEKFDREQMFQVFFYMHPFIMPVYFPELSWRLDREDDLVTLHVI